MNASVLLALTALLVVGVGVVRSQGGRLRDSQTGRAFALLTLVPVPSPIEKLAVRLPINESLRQSLATLRLSDRSLGGARVVAVGASFAAALLLFPVAPAVGVVALAGSAVAPFGVDLLVVRAAREHGREVAQQLPDALDLLSAASGAGMALDPALDLVGSRVGGAIGVELALMRRDLERGATRAAAYETLGRRVGRPDVDALIGALLRADRLGSPLAETLARQADTMRHARSERARQAAARAGPKIQLVVALLMVPATLMLVIGLLLLELTRQVSGVIGGG